MDVSTRERGTYVFGPFRLDPVRRTLHRNGNAVGLTSRLFDTLLYLVQNPERLVTRDELESAVWRGRPVEDGNLQKAVAALRRVLNADDPSGNLIVTVTGRGFQFATAVTFESDWTEASAAAASAARDAREASVPVESAPWHRRRVLAFGATGLLLAALGLWFMANRRAPGPPPFAPPPHSVAVMAFTNLSGDPAQEYFSDGLSDDLIGALGRIGGMQVVGRTSAFFYKNKTATADEIGRRLNVATILEGSVRRQGDTLHITAKLIDVVTGYQIWSHSYDRDQGQWLQTQADIAAATASVLHVMLRADDVAQLTLGGTASASALNAYLHGEKLMRLASDAAGYRAALAAFDLAVEQDPAFALAHSKRARAINALVGIAAFSGAAAMAKANADALASSDRAISLAPALGEAHASRGWVLFSGFLDIGGAVAEWERAHTLSPGNADVESCYSAAETELGHKDKAVDAARRAVELDPLLPWAWTRLASALTAQRRYDAAIDTLRYAREVVGGSDADQALQLGVIALLKGDAATALRECGAGSGDGKTECLAMVYHALGRQREAAAELEKLRRAIGDDGAYNYARIYAFWGQTADALNWLETAVRLRDPGLSQLRTDQRLDSIRDTPRFKEVERKMNLPP